ncbi:sulfotransferase [bacterium]|nr:sulfotransferase [bacterium]
MKHSYLLAGIKAGRLLSMIFRNGGFSIKFILRVLFLLNAGIWSNIFAIVEKRKYKKIIDAHQLTQAPIFVVGNWRTGTTFLHQLLSVDEQFTTPTVYQVSNPDHFLISKKYYQPIMSKALGSKRPMDNVKIGIDEPQEEEYALLKLCKNTPLEQMIFANGKRFFLDEISDYTPKGFAESMLALVKKLNWSTGKSVLFKNPFHSFRIAQLMQLFPQAKFIHIYRNPNDVIPSTQHMWNVVGTQNLLKGKWLAPTVSSVANLYNKILIEVRSQLAQLNSNQSVEITFEELEKSPSQTIQKVYEKLGLSFTDQYNTELRAYCEGLKTYKKNKYTLQQGDQDKIKEILGETIPEYFKSNNERL